MTLYRITLICGVILLLYFIYLDFTVSKMKKENKLNLKMIESIIALEKAMKKLNEALKIHEFRLDHQRDERYAIKKRLDILESGHPDTDIDYSTTDADGNITEVWFEGKRYVPEDKRDENTSTFYADNKVVAETSRPDPQPESRYTCADCVRFRRERVDGKWYGICSVDNDLVSDDKQYICDKFRIYRPTEYYVSKNMGGNGRAEELPKHIVKLNYLASDTECDELLKRVERLNRIYDTGLLSLSEYGDMLKEWMQK